MRQHSPRRQKPPDKEKNQMSKPMEDTSQKDSLVFEKLNVTREGAVLFAAINAPPMNLQGPELVRDLVSLIQRAEADDAVQVIVFKSADGTAGSIERCPQVNSVISSDRSLIGSRVFQPRAAPWSRIE